MSKITVLKPDRDEHRLWQACSMPIGMPRNGNKILYDLYYAGQALLFGGLKAISL